MRKYEGIKKIDLNCHFDGSLDLGLASKWLKLTKEETIEAMTRTNGVKNYNDYISKFKLPLSLLQSKTHIKEAMYELTETLKKENTIYAEIGIAPLLHTKKGLSIEDVVISAIEGAKLSELKSNLILIMMRDTSIEENKKIVSLAKKYLKKGVCGVSLVGDENLYPTKTFKELFEFANSKNVPFTINAGENGSYKDIMEAINLGARRIGCGVEAIKDFKTMESLKSKNIPLEVCLSVNLDINLFNSINEHPVSRLVDSGVKIVIASGNRTISKTDLSHEYYLLNKYFGYTIEDFENMNKYALSVSLLSDNEKKKILEEL